MHFLAQGTGSMSDSRDKRLMEQGFYGHRCLQGVRACNAENEGQCQFYQHLCEKTLTGREKTG
jgi:hypothetical protein